MCKPHYVEPYAGGAGAALELLFSRKVETIHLNDSSRAIYATWHSILNHADEFCRKIIEASMTVDEWQYHKSVVGSPQQHDLFELGFSTFYLNRCNRSGILSAGVIGGKDQGGNYKMDARFSRTNLIGKIQSIAENKERITLTNLDAEELIRQYDPIYSENTLIYFDPPYYVQGSDLYLNFYKKEDHLRLARLIQAGVNTNWILSYDAADEILNMYRQRQYFTYDLQYNASRVYKGREVFIFSDYIVVPKSSTIGYINLALQEFY